MTPNTLHTIWFGKNPDVLKNYAHTWLEHNPLFTHMEWSEKEVETLRGKVPAKTLRFLLKKGVSPIARSDLMRLAVLWVHGGLYVDTDMECVQPLGPIHDDDFICGLGENGHAENALIGAIAHHPVIGAALCACTHAFSISTMQQVNYGAHIITGPAVLTQAVETFGEKLAEREIFYPVCYDNRKSTDVTDNTIGIHHWHSRRR